MGHLVQNKGMSGGADMNNPVEQPVQVPVENPAEPPVEQPVQAPVEQPVQAPAEAPVEQLAEPVEPIEQPETKAVYQEVIPDCTTIVGDIKNGRIQQKNFMYLTNACNESIRDALK